MSLGPIQVKCPLTNETLVFHCLENAWQSSKVWQADLLANKTEIGPSFFARRRQMAASEKGIRHAISSKKGERPVFQLWNGERLTYIQARAKIYRPLYERLARQTDAYKRILASVKQGTNVQILGYDGFKMGVEASERELEYHLQDVSKPAGHELLLVFMLRADAVQS